MPTFFLQVCLLVSLMQKERHDVIASLDLVQDTFEIFNFSAGYLKVGGWQLFSLTGNQHFAFPPGTQIPPFKKLVVRSGHHSDLRCKGPLELHWTNRHIWNNVGDTAALLDGKGHLIKIVDEGTPFHNWPTNHKKADKLTSTQLALMTMKALKQESLPPINTKKEELLKVYMQQVVPTLGRPRKRSASQREDDFPEEEPPAKHRCLEHTPNRGLARETECYTPKENRPPWLPTGTPKGNPDAWIWDADHTPTQAPLTTTPSQSQTPNDDRPPWLPPGTPKGNPDAWIWDPTQSQDGTPRSAPKSQSRSRNMLQSPPHAGMTSTPRSLKSSVPHTAAYQTQQIPAQSHLETEALGLSPHGSPSAPVNPTQLHFGQEDVTQATLCSISADRSPQECAQESDSGTALHKDISSQQQDTSNGHHPKHTDTSSKQQQQPHQVRSEPVTASLHRRRWKPDQKQDVYRAANDQNVTNASGADVCLAENHASEMREFVSERLLKLRRLAYWMAVWIALLLGIGWAICMAVRPQHMFCDVEVAGSSRRHTNCEPCPEGGFCAEGRLWQCRDSGNTASVCVPDFEAYYYDVLQQHLGFLSVWGYGACALLLGLAFLCTRPQSSAGLRACGL